MNRRLLLSAVIAAMLAGSGMAHAQGAAPAPAADAPAADPAAPVERPTPAIRDEANDTSATPEPGTSVVATPPDDKVQRDNGDQRATDSTRDAMKPKTN